MKRQLEFFYISYCRFFSGRIAIYHYSLYNFFVECFICGFYNFSIFSAIELVEEENYLYFSMSSFFFEKHFFFKKIF